MSTRPLLVAPMPRHDNVQENRGRRPNTREEYMRSVHALAATVLSLLAISEIAHAGEKQGGIFRIYHRDSPGSASIHEEATYSTNVPFMPVFNNLVIYKQDVAQNSLDSIEPDLAESGTWSPDKKSLTFKLRQGVKWHDGKPFTSADVKCTFDMLMGKSAQKFRKNPLEPDARLRRRQVRHDVSDRSVDSAAEGRQDAGGKRGLRGRANQRQHQRHRQFFIAAVRQCRHPPRHGTGARPQRVHLHSVRG